MAERRWTLSLALWLLRLYPREFRERLSESMRQTISDQWNAGSAATDPGFTFALTLLGSIAAGILREYWNNPTNGARMHRGSKGILAVALLSAVPLFTALEVMVLGRRSYSIVATLVVILAFTLSAMPLAEVRRTGGRLRAHPAKLFVATTTFGLIVLIAGTFTCFASYCLISGACFARQQI
jgi:hypothetical protein